MIHNAKTLILCRTFSWNSVECGSNWRTHTLSSVLLFNFLWYWIFLTFTRLSTTNLINQFRIFVVYSKYSKKINNNKILNYSYLNNINYGKKFHTYKYNFYMGSFCTWLNLNIFICWVLSLPYVGLLK